MLNFQNCLCLLILKYLILAAIFVMVFLVLRFPLKYAHNKAWKSWLFVLSSLFIIFDLLTKTDHKLENTHFTLFLGLIALYWALDTYYGNRWRHASNKFTEWVKCDKPFSRYRLALQFLGELATMHLWEDKGFVFMRDNVLTYLEVHGKKNPLCTEKLRVLRQSSSLKDDRMNAVSDLADELCFKAVKSSLTDEYKKNKKLIKVD